MVSILRANLQDGEDLNWNANSIRVAFLEAGEDSNVGEEEQLLELLRGCDLNSLCAVSIPPSTHFRLTILQRKDLLADLVVGGGRKLARLVTCPGVQLPYHPVRCPPSPSLLPHSSHNAPTPTNCYTDSRHPGACGKQSFCKLHGSAQVVSPASWDGYQLRDSGKQFAAFHSVH